MQSYLQNKHHRQNEKNIFLQPYALIIALTYSSQKIHHTRMYV